MLALPRLFVLPTFLFSAVIAVAAGPFEVKETPEGLSISQDGKLVAGYQKKSGTKPIVWPIIGPGGHEMTRAYPMRGDNAEEKKDHVHHRSLWFTHGEVNGADFWAEEKKNNLGEIVHREFVKVEGGEKAIVVTRNDWNYQGKRLLEDERTLRFSRRGESLVIDFGIVLKASDGEVEFGDTKEGSFGLRVPTSMDVTAKKGGKIVNSEGHVDKDAWGKRAAWVDYHGPVAGEHLGIAVMNHPKSFRFPTYWHVRDYGLYAANPFGERDFTGNKEANAKHVMAKGESLALDYRVVFHKGDEKTAGIAAAFEEFSQSSK